MASLTEPSRASTKPIINYAYASIEDLSYIDVDEAPLSPSAFYDWSPSTRPMTQRDLSIQPVSLPSTDPLPSFYTPPVHWQRDIPLLTQGESLARSQPQCPLLTSKSFESLVALLNVVSYTGDEIDGLPHGRGTALSSSGDAYTGQWVSGTLQGPDCTVKFSDGSVYTGTITNNALTGSGTMTFVNGSHYTGDFTDGHRHGRGTFISANNDRQYTGDWFNGVRHGKGRLCYDSAGTSFYDGDWVHGQRHGVGTMVYNSGNTYSGQWQNDRKCGTGTMQWHDRGESYSGEWVDDRPEGYGTYAYLIPTSKLSINQPSINQYTGAMVGGVRHGRGSFFYADSSEYHGEFANNVKHGSGLYKWPNGSTITSQWINDAITDTVAFANTQIVRIDLSDFDDSDGKLSALCSRYYAELTELYTHFTRYSQHSNSANSLPNVRLLANQFWQCLVELRLVSDRLTFSDVNRLWLGSCTTKRLVDSASIHDENQIMWLREFVTVLIKIATHTATATGTATASVSGAFLTMLSSVIVPYLSRTRELTVDQRSMLVPLKNHRRFQSLLSRYQPSLSKLFRTLSKPVGDSANGREDRVTTVSTLINYMGTKGLFDATLGVEHIRHLVHTMTKAITISGSDSGSPLKREVIEWEFQQFLLVLALYRYDITQQQSLLKQQREIQRQLDREERQQRRQREAELLAQQREEELKRQQAEALAAEEEAAAAAAVKKGGKGAKAAQQRKVTTPAKNSQSSPAHGARKLPLTPSKKSANVKNDKKGAPVPEPVPVAVNEPLVIEDINGICQSVLDDLCDTVDEQHAASQTVVAVISAYQPMSAFVSLSANEWDDRESMIVTMMTSLLH